MAKLKNYNGRYCESEYESAFIAFLQSVGWTYLPGNKIKRCYRDVLIADDFRAFITKANTDLLEEEIEQIYDTVRLVGAESDFATLHKVYKWMVDGIQFTPQSGLPIQVTLIDFETPENNIFHVVNQLTVDYINNGQRENRRPDVLLYVNGMPLCIIELKNPADSHSTIYDAWEQITIRYWRDIPHLLHYCPLACISDGVKVESVLDAGEEEDIFSPEYFEKLSDVKMPATKLELLIKMIRKQIKEYSKINKIVAKTYQEMLEETIAIYHERRKHISAEEAGATQEQASEDIIKNATEQALQILRQMNESRESFRKIGLTFEEKAFYDILVSLRDQYNFEYGEDKEIGGMIVNDKCKILAKKVKEIIDTKSSFSDWLNNQNVRNQLKLDIKICLVKNGYPPQYSPEVFTKVMEQVENFEENSDMPMATTYTFPQSRTVSMVAEDIIPYGNKSEN